MLHPRSARAEATVPAWVVLASLAGLVVAVVATATGAQDAPALAAAVQAFVVGVPLVVGLAGWSSGSRVPRLLVGAGLGLAAVTLSSSESPLLYSIGRVAIWFLVPGVVYLVLAFPLGSLMSRRDRVLAGASVVIAAGLYLAVVPFVTAFPAPFPWSECGTECPANAFAVVDRQPAVIDDVIRPLRESATIALLVAVTAVLAHRTATARPVLRVALMPVFLVAVVNTLAIAVYLGARRVGDEGLATALGVVYMLSFPALAIAFAGGRVVRLLQAARSLERLAHALRGVGAEQLDATIAEALRDPSARLVVLPAAAGSFEESQRGGRGATPIEGAGPRTAVMLHDALLDDDPELVRAAGEIALLKVDHDRLVRRLGASLEELAESRARLVAAGDRERRRIERDLHDGAQQLLIAVRVRLSLIEEQLAGEARAIAEDVHELGMQLEEALDQVRTVGSGIYPPLLADYGLAVALRAATHRSPLPVSLDVRQTVRYDPLVESTLYFTCLEALQNALKHAAGATSVRVAVHEEDGRISFEIADDGAGMARSTGDGSGLSNMRDRVAAAGGAVRIESAVRRGTRVVGALPLRRSDAPAPAPADAEALPAPSAHG